MNPTTVERYSVQEHENANSLGYTFDFAFSDAYGQDDVLLSEWGNHRRDRELRKLYRNQFAWLAQASVSALIRKVAQTPWQLQGGRNLTSHYQAVLQDAEFDSGWSDFVDKILLDFLTCDYGAYVEIIGAGKSDSPLRGRVMGVAHLDSLRCVPTGNLEYPVVYWSRKTGTMHRLHYTRVYRLVDMVDGDESWFGAGLCALSRAVSLLQQTLNLMKYTNGQLADMPANGVLWLPPGVMASTYNDMMAEYKARREATGYKGPVAVGGASSTASANEAKFMPFSVAPDGFDYDMYIEIAVNAFAATFGIDRQDIFPLQGKMSGTATQSQVLYEKAKGMAFGDILSRLKRMINTAILPPSLEFDFEYRDEEKDRQVAERTSILLDNATKMRGLGYADQQIMQYLANQDEDLRDITLDDSGQIVSLPDDDVLDDSQTETDVVETDGENQVNPDDVIEDGDKAVKDSTNGAFAYIPVSNNHSVITTLAMLHEVLNPENVIEWQSAPTLHITLTHANEMPQSAIEQIRQTFVIPDRMMYSAFKLRTFDTPDGYALHLVVEPDYEMQKAQSKLWEQFIQLGSGVSPFSTPSEWNAHITLAYLKEDTGWQEYEDNQDVFGIADQIIISRDEYIPILTITSAKDITTTERAFMQRFDAVLAESRAGNINRRRAGILIRGMIRTFGGRAYGDGMEEGDVPRDQMDSQDNSKIASLVAQNSQYVSNLTDVIFNGNGVTDVQASDKALMWFNKTITPFYDAGRRSAFGNKMYRWVLGDTEEHCDDCSYFNGQVHRLRAFLDTGWHPKSSKLACKGFRCDCRLVPAPGASATGIMKKILRIPHNHKNKEVA